MSRHNISRYTASSLPKSALPASASLACAWYTACANMQEFDPFFNHTLTGKPEGWDLLSALSCCAILSSLRSWSYQWDPKTFPGAPHTAQNHIILRLLALLWALCACVCAVVQHHVKWPSDRPY
ncbi:hypothetical protein ABBQ32_011483 [Trebouxia sp. C0010 RCD-2024]